MADQGAAASLYGQKTYQPGNPDLPTLPAAGAATIGKLPQWALGAQFDAPPEESVLPEHAAGPARGKGFGGWYLDTTWMTPNPVDFGNITQDKQRTVTLHNTRRVAANWSAFDDASLAGFSLVTPALPINIGPFASQVATLKADATGPNSFDQEIDVTVAGTVAPLTVVGRRVIVFSTFPERPITETLRFLSDNMISKDGTEQAMGMAVAPRSIVSFYVRHSRDQERTTLYNLILGSQHLLTAVQAWWQASALTVAALSTDLVLQVDTTAMEIAAGDDLSVVLNDRTFTEAEVDSFTASSITLKEAIGIAVPIDSSVMPLRLGRSSGRVDLSTFPINAEDMRVRFTLTDYDDIANIDPAFFDTHPVDALSILKRPLFFSGSSRRGKIVSDIDRLDSRTGIIDLTRTEPIARPLQDVLVYINSTADQQAWRAWLHAVRGSWAAFYVPTGTNDLPLSSSFSLGGNTFSTPNMQTANLLGNRAPRRDVQVTIAGVQYNRRLSSVVDQGATELFTMDSVIPGSGSVPASEVSISWLTLCRIVGDVATFRHLYRGVSELRFEIRGVIE